MLSLRTGGAPNRAAGKTLLKPADRDNHPCPAGTAAGPAPVGPGGMQPRGTARQETPHWLQFTAGVPGPAGAGMAGWLV